MYSDLNSQQKSAAEAPQRPLLIVAGAGTGKTTTLTSRIAYFIKQGVSPGKICAITFTNKAAREMAERITADGALTSPGSENISEPARFVSGDLPFVGTFHSLGAKILRAESRHLGRKSNFVIFDGDDSFSLIKKIVKSLNNGKGGAKPGDFAEKISEFKSKPEKLAAAKNSAIKDRDLMFLNAFETYEEALKRNNAFDFDDLIEKPVRLLTKHPEILKKYQKKFDALLIDEYQDLNPMQYELVKLLAGGHKNLSAVGDDEQLIYGWRHANLQTFLNFERDWPNAQISFLEENYRSTSNIINAASAVVQNNKYRRPKNLWTKNAAGSRIMITEVFDEIEEAERIAQAIEMKLKKCGGGNRAKNDQKENIAESPNIAVLYRTNAQSRAVEQSLLKRKIPYRIFGGIRFYERKEIKDIIAALRYSLNKGDELSRERLTKNFSRRSFLAIENAFSAEKGAEPSKLIEIFIKAAGYLEYLEKNFANYAERQENIGELLNFSLRFKELPQLLEEIALLEPADVLGNKRNRGTGTNNKKMKGDDGKEAAVKLMTIHLAKGLEFDDVFIAGCSEGIIPHARSLEDEHQLEEERRLMYVAMTRAKKELALSFYDIPSRFLGEIPDNLFSFKSSAGEGEGEIYEEEKIVID